MAPPEQPDRRTAETGAPVEPSSLELEDEPIVLSDLRPEDSLVFVLFWVLSVVVFLQFFTRYVLNDSLAWTEEIARYLLIGVTFVGAVIGVRKRDHIAVELLERYLSPRGNNVVSFVIDAASAVTFFFFAFLTARLALRTKQMMVSIDVPKAYVYWLVSASFLAMGFWALHWLWRRLRGRVAEQPSHPAATD